LLSLLALEGFVQQGAEDLSLQHWEFHDLLFHTRSRRGRTGAVVGASFRFRGKTRALPGLKPPMSAFPIALPRPDLQALMLNDITVTAALESRASIRQPNARAPTVVELGHFLYRSARVRHLMTYQDVELTNRPYPSGGASYELEIYPIIDRCAGLLSGVYHYDPLAHTLEPVAAVSAASETALRLAHGATAGSVRPSILLMVTARFRRVTWKYESIAYATILKDVGALYQTMYIVATAMRLAPCAIGAGDSDLFSEILGNDYLEESAVGEFMLNGRAEA
jgi:SagB-type dehydrogenase family enzyme